MPPGTDRDLITGRILEPLPAPEQDEAVCPHCGGPRDRYGRHALATPPPEQDEAVRLRQAIETEWYNGNMSEDTMDRILASPPPVPAALDVDEALLQYLHDTDLWQDGGNHPNTSSIWKCGSCIGIIEGYRARLSHQSEDQR